MPVAIQTDKVREALRPRVGSDIVKTTDIVERVAHILRSYAPYRDTLEDLADQVSNTLFDCLYGALGPSMTVHLDDGQTTRIHIHDLPDLADDVLGAYFESMTVYSVSYATLKDYSLRTGSLNAIRVLYQNYDAFQSPEEKALMARIVRDRFPTERYSAWLHDEEANGERADG